MNRGQSISGKGPHEKSDKYYKNNINDSIWWVDTSDNVGLFLFSFDKKTVFNLFRDYPWKLTKEQIAVFDKENPFGQNSFQTESK